MLVLTRRVGEEVVIGDHIRITLVATHGQQVRLGITAPNAVSILRNELVRLADHPCAGDSLSTSLPGGIS